MLSCLSLLRAREEGLTMILLNSNWPTQPWYSQILDLCITVSNPDPISGTFGRSQGASTSSSVEQDFKTNCPENFKHGCQSVANSNIRHYSYLPIVLEKMG